jgi:hypothetical protein
MPDRGAGKRLEDAEFALETLDRRVAAVVLALSFSSLRLASWAVPPELADVHFDPDAAIVHDGAVVAVRMLWSARQPSSCNPHVAGILSFFEGSEPDHATL